MSKELIIDVQDNISYKTHVEILNEIFGKDYKAHFKATYQVNETVKVWFPKIEKDCNGNIKPNSSGWVNRYNSNCSIITTIPPVPRHPSKSGEIVLIFIMFGHHDYRFVGAFLLDCENSNEHIHIKKRITTKVKLIGKPVDEIELIY